MIGRADIEGSKSNVAMNAWLPQASYPCGNFSDTSSFKFRRTKGSIGHTFTVRIRTRNQNQTSFYPFVPHEISVLVELILGHLRYLLTDVPPQPNSPPDNVFRPDRPAEAGLGSKNRGNAPPPIHGIIGLESSSTGSSFPADSAKPVPLAVVSLDSRQGHRIPLVRTSSESTVRRPGKRPRRARSQSVPRPARGTRTRRESSSSSPPTADGFGTGTPVPSPQSQSFSRGYGSILPTSLAYIVPSTRGCSPWRPDAVMSTTGRGRHSVLRIFKGRRGRTGHHATCGALPAAGPYLRLSRFQGGQAICTDGRSARAHAPGFAATVAPSYSSGPGPCPDGRVSAQLGTVTQLPVHPASPVLLTKNGPLGALDSVERLNGAATPSYLFKSDERFARQYRCGPPPEFPLASPRSGIVHHLSGPDSSGLGHHRNLRRSMPRVDWQTGSRRSTSDRGTSPAPIRFPPDNFKHSLTLFSKSFSSFPRGTCSLSVSRQYLALDEIYRPIGAAFPNNPTRRQRLVVRQGPGTTGLSPSPAPPSRGLGPGPPLRTLLQTTIRTPRATDSHGGLFPVRSPLLRESFHHPSRRRPPPRTQFSTNREALLAGSQHSPSSVPSTRPKQWGNDGRHPGRRALSLMASGATCVQRLDGSRDSAIHTKYRISLRSSSMQEPRYPLPRVFRIRVSHHRPHEHRLRADGGALNDFDFLGAFGAGFLLFNREETDRTRSGASRHEGDRGAEHL
ncbi:hypothetical protein RIF29_02292 [Crotalaria pallida]|uniref:Senescence-associated protein n=1 Tax=Crotalaria pallida TaxID=3830 RepID=A0AAN9P8M3_CROPI